MKRNNSYYKKGSEIENPVVYPALSSDEDKYLVKNEGTHNKKSKWFLFLIFLCLTIIVGRIFFLQVIKGEYYQGISENNRIRSITIKAPRGLIKDSQGQILAQNIPSFDLVFIPIDLPKEEDRKNKIFQDLADFLNTNKKTLALKINEIDKNSKKRYLVKENLNNDQALIFSEKIEQFPGFYLEKSAIRDYVNGKVFAHIIGYSGKINKKELENNKSYLMTDSIGKNGLEYTYEKWLRGEHGYQKVEVDSSGNIKEELGIVNPQRGDTLILNINAKLQKKAYEVLNKTLEENKDAVAASMVAINPQSGAVKALVNIPSYDNNLFAREISGKDYEELINNEKKPMLNRAVSGEYPPGSTFKPFVAVGALEEGVINENTTIDCHGLISIGEWKFPDWKTHGLTDIKKAIAQSCDVFFYSIGGGWGNISGLGMNKIKEYANYFGLGKLTGIDLPWESSAIVPNKEWKFKKFGEKWYIGDDYHSSIGQGFIAATPLQLAAGTAAIANGGTFYRPQVVDKIIDHAGQENDLPPEAINSNLVNKESIRIVKEGMKQTVFGEEGSGRQLKSLSQPTAGKTGTAQFGNEDKTHSWFISFGPYDNPDIALAILIEGGGEGHDWAVPATKNILEWYYNNSE